MRIDVKKFLFIGVKEERNRFFALAQEAGVIHFIEPKSLPKEIPASIENIHAAIKILRGLPVLHQEELERYSLANGLVDKILSYRHKEVQLEEELRTTRLEIERVAVFGDFSLTDIDWIEKEGKRKIQFFFTKHSTAKELEIPEEVIYTGTQHELDYFVAVNSKPKEYPKLIEMKIDRPLGELQQRYQEIIQEIHELNQKIKTYAKYNQFLHHALIDQLNNYHLNHTENSVKWPIEDHLFMIEGWIPVNKVAKVEKCVHEMHVHMEEVAIGSSDVIPTYLENEGLHRLGEDLVHIYDTPSPTDKDPSLWVLFSFALFFSFIVGDEGYGLIFLLIALYCHYKFPDLKGVKLRVLKLVGLLCIACIAWGFLTNSFFGISFSPDHPIRKASLIQWLIEKKAAYHMEKQDEVYHYWVKLFPDLAHAKSPNEFATLAATETEGRLSYDLVNKFSDSIMLELALFIGVIHVILSMLRYLNRNWSNLGWIAFIVGCYLYFPHYLQATSLLQYVFGMDPVKAAANGIYLITGGLALAVVIALIRDRLLGLIEATNMIQVFSDVLSYLRLYALGLAGSIVVSVMNDAVAAVPLVVGILILIVGHAINMALAVMSGIIHGLRLNFLEWYHYSFEGGGTPFKPLEKLKID